MEDAPVPRQSRASSASSSVDKGARALVRLFLFALVVGAFVVALHPRYRAAFLALLRGDDASNPLYQSNVEHSYAPPAPQTPDSRP